MSKPVIEIDGALTTNLDAFFDEVSKKLIPAGFWGRNLGEGATIFDILIEIIRTPGPGGAEGDDGVERDLA